MYHYIYGKINNKKKYTGQTHYNMLIMMMYVGLCDAIKKRLMILWRGRISRKVRRDTYTT